MKLKALNPTHIICSTQLRAVQTTRIISYECHDIIPITNGAFEELGRPEWLVGVRYTGITTLWYIWRWFMGSKIEGGESYPEFLARIKTAREFLETFPEDARVVVVSHAVFTNIFLEHLCSDKPMSFLRAAKRFWHILTLRNAAIIHIAHDSSAKNVCAWRFASASQVKRV